MAYTVIFMLKGKCIINAFCICGHMYTCKKMPAWSQDFEAVMHVRAQVYKRLEEIDAHGAEARAGAILAGLSFEPDMQQRATKTFSGGWRMRVAVHPQALLSFLGANPVP